MRFTLSSAQTFFEKPSQDLVALGFKFKTIKLPRGRAINGSREAFCIQDDGVSIEINSLEDLLKIVDRFGQLIVDRSEITIYNDYIE